MAELSMQPFARLIVTGGNLCHHQETQSTRTFWLALTTANTTLLLLSEHAAPQQRTWLVNQNLTLTAHSLICPLIGATSTLMKIPLCSTLGANINHQSRI